MARNRILDLVSILVALAVGAVGLLLLPMPHDQLAILERSVRSRPSLGTLYLAPQDDNFYGAAQVVTNAVEGVLGIAIVYEPMKNVAGWTQLDGSERVLHIDKDLHWTARLEVIAHEAGHRLQPPSITTTSDGEMFAEAVSYLVCREFGHDSLDTSARYLAIHKGSLHILTDYKFEIQYAVAVLSGGR